MEEEVSYLEVAGIPMSISISIYLSIYIFTIVLSAWCENGICVGNCSPLTTS